MPDSPSLPRSLLEDALRALRRRRVALGPSVDGGYYLIGMSRHLPHLFGRIDWSTARVCYQTLARAGELRLSPALLPVWYDVDDAGSLERLRADLAARPATDASCPHTRAALRTGQIDTYKASVAGAAVTAGAVMVNDVSGLQFDPPLARVAATSGAALILMHTRGRPQTMAAEAVYTDVTAEVVAELRTSIAAACAAGVAIERIIADPGIGIEPDFLPRIFDRFEHREKRGDYLFGGIGLGLAIARHIIESFGGKIYVDSEVDRGSVFTVRLPVLAHVHFQLGAQRVHHRRTHG